MSNQFQRSKQIRAWVFIVMTFVGFAFLYLGFTSGNAALIIIGCILEAPLAYVISELIFN